MYYPSGGILMWFIIILELFTFLCSISFYGVKKEPLQEFTTAKIMLNSIIGTINTIVLIASGYFMALSVNKLSADNSDKSALFMLICLLLGIAFLGIKGVEYYHKIEMGIGLFYNTFFIFYWLMTGLHFVHILFGVLLLAYLYFAIKKEKYNAKKVFDVEASATYWYICDLIWILIFPILYLYKNDEKRNKHKYNSLGLI